MPTRSTLRADIDLRAPGKASGFVRIPHSVQRSAYGWIPVPITCIQNGEGPSVLMMAGNHGDEWEGQIGLGNLIRSLQPTDIKGRLVILPSVNFPAAMAGLRTSPIDQGNLNRAFPGDPHGTVTAQLAYWIEHVLLPGFDYSFDFHSGGSSLIYLPSTLIYRVPDAEQMRRAMALVQAFAAPIGYVIKAPSSGGRSFTAASLRQGVLSLATEVGGGGLVTPSSLALMERGMRRLMSATGLVDLPLTSLTETTRMTEVGTTTMFTPAMTDCLSPWSRLAPRSCKANLQHAFTSTVRHGVSRCCCHSIGPASCCASVCRPCANAAIACSNWPPTSPFKIIAS